MKPRWYQQDLIDKTRAAWASGAQNVLVVSPPRSGKTPTAVWLSEPFIAEKRHVCVQVHREELVRQIADTYASFGYYHNVIAPSDVITNIIHSQVKRFGKSYIRKNAYVTVGSVQTILSRAEKLIQWASMVNLWITDEAHHCLKGNLWGRVTELFPNAYGLGFTATPARTDRKSLAREQGGMFDTMVKGVTARQLINEGHICDYRIIAPPSSIDRTTIKVGSTGDFTQSGLSKAREKSTITGDCVKSYMNFTPGEQAVVFAVDVEHAKELAQAYRDAGVSAEMVSAKTPKSVRKALMDKFERGVFKVLCNVDLFGEGLNVLGISTVIMARPTQSFVLYTQQFFRALTAADGKHLGTIIDHAGNVGFFGKLYGLPDSYNKWSLYAEERGKRGERDPDVMPVKTCTSCFAAYEAVTKACPFCGHVPEPESRGGPEYVDGDLIELDAETLAAMRGEIDKIDGPAMVPYGATNVVEASVKKRWRERQEAQAELRNNIAMWAGVWRDKGADDSEIYRRFFFTFGTDIMSAQALGRADAEKLSKRIESKWNN